jgi:uncharacterized membrane protein
LREWLIFLAENAITIINGLALVVIVVGTIEAFITGLRFMFPAGSGHQVRDVWLRYARWLVGGLTFQLAADILETSITTSWEAIGRIAAVAVLRTFLNYFLETDLTEIRERQRAAVD